MPFNIRCTHKDCRKDSTPELEIKTNKIFCSECHQELPNISSYQREIIKASGQLLKNNYQHESFTVDCKKCNRVGRPIHAKDGKILCHHCREELTQLSKVFCHMLRQQLPKEK